MYWNFTGLTLNECIEKMSKFSDAYIEAVLYGKLKHKHSLTEISQAIVTYRTQNNFSGSNGFKMIDRTKTVRNIIFAASQQTKVNLNMETFNRRKGDIDFLKACARQLQAEIVYKHI